MQELFAISLDEVKDLLVKHIKGCEASGYRVDVCLE
jgi:hypothetical protein